MGYSLYGSKQPGPVQAWCVPRNTPWESGTGYNPHLLVEAVQHTIHNSSPFPHFSTRLQSAMSELRQRQAPQRIPEEQRALLQKSKGGTVGGYQRAPPPPRRSDRSLHIAFSLMILVFFVIYANNKNSAPIKYTVDGTKLPQWYALCGTWGRPIYTLPVEGGEGKVECVVVNGKYIADTGSLGELPAPDKLSARAHGSEDKRGVWG